MKGNLTGLVLSSTIHAGFVLLVSYGLLTMPAVKETEKSVPLKLSFFQPPTPSVVHQKEVAVITPVTPQPVRKPTVHINHHKPVTRHHKIRKKITRKKSVKKPLKNITKTIPPNRTSAVTVPESVISHTPVVTVQHSAKPVTTHSQQASAEQQYQHHLWQLISQHKHYPPRARHKRQQGTVRISFVLLASGDIENIKILKSSGSRLLDQSAIHTIRQLSGQLPFPETLHRKQWAFTLPLVYALH